VLSPHLDDAALSAGGTIHQAVKSGADVVIGTIFTADSSQSLTSPMIELLNEAWSLGPSPMRSRREEDIAAVNTLGARFIHGDLLDAIYRTDRDGNCLYPTRTAVFSDPSPEDPIGPALNELLLKWIETIRPDAISCPLAVGRHVDHVITSESFRRIAVGLRSDVFLYEDMPYSTGRFPAGFPDSVEAALKGAKWAITGHDIISIDISPKISALLKYQSQLKDLFPDAVDVVAALKESYGTNQGPFFERFWRTTRDAAAGSPSGEKT
jgi:LmbE family N-acetylglucosaminyl deacetylase